MVSLNVGKAKLMGIRAAPSHAKQITNPERSRSVSGCERKVASALGRLSRNSRRGANAAAGSKRNKPTRIEVPGSTRQAPSFFFAAFSGSRSQKSSIFN
jgi:hypothetical protein